MNERQQRAFDKAKERGRLAGRAGTDEACPYGNGLVFGVDLFAAWHLGLQFGQEQRSNAGRPILQEKLEVILRAAMAIAAYPPVEQSQYAFSAQVPWSRIHGLRQAIEAAGLDWRLVKARRDV